MSQYRDEGQAVARAINAGEGRPIPAKWQSQHSSGYRESALGDSDPLTGIDRLLADSITHAVIRKALTPAQYSVIILKYSGTEGDRIAALKALIPVVGTNAGPSSKALSIGAWASPAYKSAPANYDQQDVSDRTLQLWRQQIKKTLDKLHGEAMTTAQSALRDRQLIGY